MKSHAAVAGHIWVILVVAVPLLAVVWLWDRRATRRRQREVTLAHALGRNAGMSATEVKDMHHRDPHITANGGRWTKLAFHVPAHLTGELLADPATRTKAEGVMRATIAAEMGHVLITIERPHRHRPTGKITLTRGVVPKPVPEKVDAAVLVDAGRLNLPLGVGADGKQIGWNISPKGAGIAHLLVYGETGAGKTEALLLVAGEAMDRGHQVYIIDSKADDFEEWQEAGICPVATTPEAITKMAAQLRKERERRVHDYKKHRRMAMLTSGELPSILVVVDEMAVTLNLLHSTARKPAPAMEDLLVIAQQGRSVGMHLAVGTQYPNVDAVGGGSFRGQLGIVLALGALDGVARKMTDIKGEVTAYPRGRGMVKWPGHEVEVQVGLSDPRARIITITPTVDEPSSENASQNVRTVTCENAPETIVRTVPKNSPIKEELSDEDKAEIRRLRAAGDSYGTIAAKTGHVKSAVYKYAKDVTVGEVPVES